MTPPPTSPREQAALIDLVLAMRDRNLLVLASDAPHLLVDGAEQFVEACPDCIDGETVTLGEPGECPRCHSIVDALHRYQRARGAEEKE